MKCLTHFVVAALCLSLLTACGSTASLTEPSSDTAATAASETHSTDTGEASAAERDPDDEAPGLVEQASGTTEADALDAQDAELTGDDDAATAIPEEEQVESAGDDVTQAAQSPATSAPSQSVHAPEQKPESAPAEQAPAAPAVEQPDKEEPAAEQPAVQPSAGATLEDAMALVGQNISSLYAIAGKPVSTHYEYSCSGPGDDGVLTYPSFLVFTYVENGVETIVDVEGV